jgi:hypothetical protein
MHSERSSGRPFIFTGNLIPLPVFDKAKVSFAIPLGENYNGSWTDELLSFYGRWDQDAGPEFGDCPIKTSSI